MKKQTTPHAVMIDDGATFGVAKRNAMAAAKAATCNRHTALKPAAFVTVNRNPVAVAYEATAAALARALRV